MVYSQINENIAYDKKLTSMNDDLDHQSSIYEMELLGKDVEIVLGKERKNENLSYFIAYIVLNNGRVRPIGLFEIESDKIDGIYDNDGDIELDTLVGPLLFENIDLSDSLTPTEQEQTLSPTEEEEHKADADQEQTLSPVVTGLWIQQFLQDKKFGITDNEGGGDCLFATIRDAFQEKGITYTVGDLRKKLSDESTQELFENYRTLYTSFETAIKQTKEAINKIATENNELKTALTKEENTSKQIAIVEKAKKLKTEFYKLKNELSISQQMMNEQKFMKNITSLNQFKAVINTCRFWGDTWAISTLERVLNTKFILLSEENFKLGDITNVLQCGQLNDSVLKEKGAFTPDYYIMMDYTGDHYKLITYGTKSIFSFQELPENIRNLIIDKCLERLAGPYAIIPEFLAEKAKREKNENENKTDMDVSNIQSLNIDPETVFMFYSRSNSKPLPGKGSGEIIKTEKRGNYKKLAGIKDWRKKLSNSWVAPIDVDGYQWQTLEHFYQGSKYKKSRPDIYYQFTLDSRSELGKSVEKAKSFQDFEPDIDFFGKRGKDVLKEGLNAKYTQHPDLRDILLNTLDATLMEYIPRKPPQLAIELMTLRKNLTLM